MRRSIKKSVAVACILAIGGQLWGSNLGLADQIKVSLPLPRKNYQTNESIGVMVIRYSDKDLSASDLIATLTSDTGSKLTFTFPVEAVQAIGGKAISTEHLNFNGWLLRPGHYTLEISVDGALGNTDFDVYSHVRESTFRLVDWGNPDPAGQLIVGEESLGYNLVYGNAGLQKHGNHLIAGGVDQMSVCTMSGGHQMDLRMECDWSDPLVSQGGTRRVVRRALADRTDSNVIGVHFYDEPGLTWGKDPETGDTVPHSVPTQHRSYESAFGKPPIRYNHVDPSKPQDAADWNKWATWKLGFMDAAWKDANSGVLSVNPNYLGLTQSQYGYSAFADGYYFNVVRSLPIISGHGGYDDYGPGYFNPSTFLELARGRDYARPDWYLPLWYGGTEPNRARAQQYLSFITHIQGLITPPEMEPGSRPSLRQPLVESNHVMMRLGTVFNAMPVTREPVAVLYSLSNMIHTETADMKANYAHGTPHGATLAGVLLAGVKAQYHIQTVMDEDILDGTLAADHKAVIISAVDYLPAPVIKGLEDFAAHGGQVLLTSDSTVKIAGAVQLGERYHGKENAEAAARIQEEIKKIPPADKEKITKLTAEAAGMVSLGSDFKAAEPLAKALKAHLEKVGIRPVLETDKDEIAVSRQGEGDVSYVFAVNATFDYKKNQIQSMAQDGLTANLSIPVGKGAIYDAITGGSSGGLKPSGEFAKGQVRFGPGQMHAYAITARPIGGVKIATPTLFRNLTVANDPIHITLGATVVDNKGEILSGSIPLEFKVIDPQGDVRFTAYRATTDGVVSFELPLAANDGSGTWEVVAHDLLSHSVDSRKFEYHPAKQCGAIAGTTQRAVYFPGDDDRVFRFARQNQDVTIVIGESAFDAAAAERVKNAIAPWGVRAKIVKAADVNKAKTISEAEACTFTGLEFAGQGQIKPGDGNPPETVGYAIDGPVILIGNPGDGGKENPLIAYLNKAQFLPYETAPDAFPGRGRGLVAWQRDAIGRNQESVALIAYDEAGMAEAAGTFYEMVAGMQALTRWQLPASNSVEPAKDRIGNYLPTKRFSRMVLPDRVLGFKSDGKLLSALTLDGSITEISLDGAQRPLKTLDAADMPAAIKEYATVPAPDKAALEALKASLIPNRLAKHILEANGLTAIIYWGGAMQVLADGKQVVREQLPADPTAIAWVDGKLVVGLATGEVNVFEVGK